jgi:hypothetical protein
MAAVGRTEIAGRFRLAPWRMGASFAELSAG